MRYMDWSAHFKDKKITVMGLGLLGRAVNDAKFLAEQGAELMVTDLKTEAELAESLEKLKGFSNITYRLGGHDLADFRGRDYVLKAAGVPLQNAFIDEARKNRIPVKMSASWFAEIAKVKTVGVTGTRGKTTTTMMLYDIMRAAGMDVILGGNIRGVSTLALLNEVTPDSVALMELDSWQCQGWGEVQMSPHIAVFTTFMEDHMNYYKNDMNAYLIDKAQIFLYQKPEDTLVVSEHVLSQLNAFKHGARAHVRVARAGKLELSVLGEHNQLNAACALEAARALDIDDTVSLKALKNFMGVDGRLQLIREYNGIKIYNDTTATTPDATMAALDALGTKNTILIMGGADKGLDMSKLEARLPDIKKVIRIKQGLAEALGEALAAATTGDTVLFSPAHASFGMFKNEYDRGDQFNVLVAAL